MVDRTDDHPDSELLERFMRHVTDAAERRRVVRHLLAGCSRCVAVTRSIWSFGELGEAEEGDADRREPERLDLPVASTDAADAAGLHRQALELMAAGRGAAAFPALARARRLYRRLGDGANLVRLRHLEGKIGEALGATREAEAAFIDARQGFLRAGLGGEAAEALLDLAILYAGEGRSDEILPLTRDLLPLLRTRDIRPGVAAALLFLRRLAETEHATLEVLSEIARYVSAEPSHRGQRRTGVVVD
jgi:tetratricopeptide (TPR) repeat protein